jgi:hypothetical protein
VTGFIDNKNKIMENNSEIVIYKNQEGSIKIDVQIDDETVWLSQAQTCELFQKSKATISQHIKNIFEEGELNENSVVRKFRTTAEDGKSYDISHYNLDVVISVGYRVKSPQGTQFRIWATQRLREHIVKGFTLNDERFKSGTSMNYFHELLERIREIRISEKMFYQQVKDIYATSIDYNPSSAMTQKFFKEVQNKLLWAISGKTAAELIFSRVNAKNAQMGLQSTKTPNKVLKSDAEIAKNYLNENEVQILKLLVEQFLAFAESQALSHKPMYMKDWIVRLSMILTMNEKNILQHAGKISHELAMRKVDKEYGKFKEQLKLNEKVQSLKELEEDLKRVKRIPKSKG